MSIIRIAKKLSPLKISLEIFLNYSEDKQGGQNMYNYKTNAVMSYSRKGNAFCNPQDQICSSKQLPTNI